MSRFKAPKASKPGTAKTLNLAGGEAFDRDPRTELASIAQSSMVKATMYKDENFDIRRVRELLPKVGVEFAAKAALHARHAYGLRSISHVIAAEVARTGGVGREFFTRVVFRLDDMREIASYYLATYGKPLPNAMRRGFAKVLEGAKPGLLAKWRGSSGFTLRSLANLVHPKGAEGSAIYQLRGGTLKPADTHEVAMTRAKGDAEKVKQEWGRLLAENQIKYLAAIRNVRRILEQAPECAELLAAKIESERDIRESKVLPFQIHTAIQVASTLQAGRLVLPSLSKALDISVANVPAFEGTTLVALDDSGSMVGMGGYTRQGISPTSTAAIAALFGVVIYKANPDCDFLQFSNDARYRTLDTTGSVSSMMGGLQFAAGGTNFHSIFEKATRAYDRIIILSDMQGWVGYHAPTRAFELYKQKHACKPRVYSWDFNSPPSAMFPEPMITCVAGFNDRALDLIRMCEQDPRAMVREIEAVDFTLPAPNATGRAKTKTKEKT